MSNPRIKRIAHPTFTDAEMLAINPQPILLKGEIVFIIDPNTFEVLNYKTGDGFNVYSALPFREISTYPYNDLVTNQIGDILAGSNQAGRNINDMLKDMISPYATPAVSNVRTNADGSNYLNTSQLEIGQNIGSAIVVTFDVSNQSNLVDPDPITVSAADFLPSNPYPNAPISLSPNGVLAPVEPKVYQIQVRAAHTNGVGTYVSAYIRFDTRFIWGASNLADLTTNQHALDLIANGGGQGVQQGWAADYEITSAGYGFVLIPSILGAAPVWTEVSDPNAPASIGMVFMGALSVNNGVGTYNYDKWRTPFNNLESVKLKAS